MPKPGPVSVPIVNGDFESTRPGLLGNPEGWFSVQHAGELSYVFRLDPAIRHSGAQSLRIDNVGPEPYGEIHQQLGAASFRGKTLRVRGWIRTRGVTGNSLAPGAVLTLQALRSGAIVAYNHGGDEVQKGDSEWTRHDTELAIPSAADQIEFGAMLPGPGQMWVDDIEVLVLPK